MTRDESIRQAAEEISEAPKGADIAEILSRHWPMESWPVCLHCEGRLEISKWERAHGDREDYDWEVEYLIACEKCRRNAKGRDPDAALAAFREQNGEYNG